MIGEVLEGYAAVGDDWIARSEAISCETLFAPVADLFPQRPLRIADIGAGTGRVTWTWLVLARPSHLGEPCQVPENSSSMNNGMA